MKRRRFIGNVLQAGVLGLLVPTDLQAIHLQAKHKGAVWQIKQFKDKGLAHFSYAILADKKIILVDPGRDPQQYFQFANDNDAKIVGVIETHPHADFISSHAEIYRKTGAVIYTSALIKPSYSFTSFDEGDIIRLADNISLRSIYTPGHAPDGISAIFQVDGKDIAVFSGDSLLIGDVGRPDLREYSGDVHSQRQELAAKMYDTIWQKFDPLADDVILYPAHGAGSLCAKTIRDAESSTIGYEKKTNYAFEKRPLQDFVNIVLSGLPEVPSYFPYDVALNVKGAEDFDTAISNVKILQHNYVPENGTLIVDARPEDVFKHSFINGSYNIPEGGKFETWLGSIIKPEENFYLVAAEPAKLSELIVKAAKIGYESRMRGAFVYNKVSGNKFPLIDLAQFTKDYNKYTIIDVRSHKEFADDKLFTSAINIPLNELTKHINEIPSGKPVVIHCASGYRSAIGSSILKRYLPGQTIFDLGNVVLEQDFERKK